MLKQILFSCLPNLPVLIYTVVCTGKWSYQMYFFTSVKRSLWILGMKKQVPFSMLMCSCKNNDVNIKKTIAEWKISHGSKCTSDSLIPLYKAMTFLNDFFYHCGVLIMWSLSMEK